MGFFGRISWLWSWVLPACEQHADKTVQSAVFAVNSELGIGPGVAYHLDPTRDPSIFALQAAAPRALPAINTGGRLVLFYEDGSQSNRLTHVQAVDGDVVTFAW